MAYRAGAEISGKEFQDPHWTRAETPAMGPRPGQNKAAEGKAPKGGRPQGRPPMKYFDLKNTLNV